MGNRTMLIGGALVAIGAAYIYHERNKRTASTHGDRNLQTIRNFEKHWSPEARVAAGLVGGGLLLYGMRASGRTGRLASTTGAGLLARSLSDRPIENWSELLRPHIMIGG